MADSRIAASEATAEDLLRQAIALDPDFALAHADLGNLYYRKAEREARLQGEHHLVKALGLLDRLSTREAGLGQHQAAVEAFKRVPAIDPSKAAARINLTTCYAAFGDPRQAVAEYRIFRQDRGEQAGA